MGGLRFDDLDQAKVRSAADGTRGESRIRKVCKGLELWCGREDLNLHDLSATRS